MFFPAINAQMPTELLVLRMASAVETEAERQNLIAAWRQCLQNGPTKRRK